MSMFGRQVKFYSFLFHIFCQMCTRNFVMLMLHASMYIIYDQAVQVIEYESSGIKLGAFKSINESLTRVAVYVSLMALYCLGGSKVKAVSILSFCTLYMSFLVRSFEFSPCTKGVDILVSSAFVPKGL